MRRSCTFIPLLSLAISVAPPAWCQTTAPAEDRSSTRPPVTPPELVVTGRRPVDRTPGRTFARQISEPVDGQISRFQGMGCPKALGFPAGLARQIEARMRVGGAAIGVPMADRNCKGNLLVMAADSGSDMVREMSRLNSHLVRGLTDRRIGELIAETGPARAWAFTEIQNAYGASIIGQGDFLPVYHDSSLTTSTQQAITMSIVVIDWNAMMGKTPTQIADYATMRTVANTRAVTKAGSVDSILTLFLDGATPPDAMTVADTAYLKALYNMQLTRRDNIQVHEMGTGVERALRPQATGSKDIPPR